MGLLDVILRDQLRRRYGYGYGHRRRRSRYHGPFILGRPSYRSPRRRRNVHVRFGGCCLPIPLGVLAGSGLATRALVRRRSR